MIDCLLCRHAVTGPFVRFLILDETGNNIVDKRIHRKCYDKILEFKVLPLSQDVVIYDIRKKAKQRIPLTTPFEPESEEQSS